MSKTVGICHLADYSPQAHEAGPAETSVSTIEVHSLAVSRPRFFIRLRLQLRAGAYSAVATYTATKAR